MNRAIVLSLIAVLPLALHRPLARGRAAHSGSPILPSLTLAAGAVPVAAAEAPSLAPIRPEPAAMEKLPVKRSSHLAELPSRAPRPEAEEEPRPEPKRVQLAQGGMVIMAGERSWPRKPPEAKPRKVYSEGVYVVGRRGHRMAYLKGIIAGAPVHVVQADLRNPDVKVGIVVARGGIGSSEGFLSMINRTQPAAAITGTFFGLRNGLPTGDIVVNGRAIYRGFIGTALAITDGNVVSFIPTGYNEATNWSMFDTVVRGGPRLVQAGMMAVNPLEEGFRTLAGDAYRSRTAIGITRERKLLLVTVKTGVTLRRLAMVMRGLGAYHAVALDGGTSTAMSFGGRLVAQPGRALTNLVVVYADRDRYERARRHFYYQARRRILPSGPPELTSETLAPAGPAVTPAAPAPPAQFEDAPPSPGDMQEASAVAGSDAEGASDVTGSDAEETSEGTGSEAEETPKPQPLPDPEDPPAGPVPDTPAPSPSR